MGNICDGKRGGEFSQVSFDFIVEFGWYLSFIPLENMTF